MGILEGLEFDSIYYLTQTMIIDSLSGAKGSQEQYLAIQYLRALIHTTDQTDQHSNISSFNRTRLFMILAHTLPAENQEHTTLFSQYAPSAFNQYKSDNDVNNRIIDSLSQSIADTYNHQ